MRKTILPILLALALIACGEVSREEWLHGTWFLAHNPQQDSEDELSFSRDGTVAIHTARGEVIRGKYLVSEGDLSLVLDMNGRPLEVHFEIAPDHSRLTYQNGAYYAKRE